MLGFIEVTPTDETDKVIIPLVAISLARPHPQGARIERHRDGFLIVEESYSQVKDLIAAASGVEPEES